MKVGDIVLCTKDYVTNNRILYKKGQKYTINNIYFIDDYKTHFGFFYDAKRMYIPTKWIIINTQEINIERHFSMDKIHPMNYFWDFFIHTKKLRNLKLKELDL